MTGKQSEFVPWTEAETRRAAWMLAERAIDERDDLLSWGDCRAVQMLGRVLGHDWHAWNDNLRCEAGF